ncbi:ABC transporter ATP-binding protein [Halosegnis marinus]|uniref:ABC transporter ATP-binding protein n=1 Tax=Halosegnis marinus TaxID=3034023 RepID=A0ABD5ZR20_9EURY|nr:ABC transporter ATP-binding protein [Halosegnis sp. DT85]
MAAIELSHLTKRYGDVLALDDVSLTVEAGEVFGFLGPNGAGKSTTIDVLLDFVRPTSGKARVLGFDAQRDGLDVRRRTGVLPDGYHVYDRLTGRQHVQFAVDSKGTDDDAAALLDRVGIADAADRPAGGYSKGMRQRLVLAMALVGEPDLLILDEPSTGLDPRGASEMRDIIRAEAARGATVFFSSHILEQVEAVCDRVAIIDEGRLVTVDTIEGLRAAMGDGDTLTLTLDAVPEGLAEAVGAVDGVSAVAVDADARRVTVHADGPAKAAVVNAVGTLDATVLDLATSEASLEELFMSATADEDAAAPDDAAPAEVAP